MLCLAGLFLAFCDSFWFVNTVLTPRREGARPVRAGIDTECGESMGSACVSHAVSGVLAGYILDFIGETPMIATGTPLRQCFAG